MFDFAWSEIALIVGVALIAIGPKDLPVAIKAVSQTIKKARKMAGEFQTHIDEMVREANLGDVRESFNDLRRMDIKGQIMRAVDGDGSIRKTFTEPMTDFSPPPPPVPVHDAAPTGDTIVEERPELGVEATAEHMPEAGSAEHIPEAEPAPIKPRKAAPAFIPPKFDPAHDARPAPAPAFIPPAVAASRSTHA